MKINKRSIAVLFSTALLMTTTFGTAATSFADTTTSDATTSTEQVQTANQSSANDSATTAKTQATTAVDASAIKNAMLSEINDLRVQNGLNALTEVGVLNNYAQQRTDSFAGNGTGIDNHVGWDSSNMAPYNLTAEENIGQLPLGTLSNDPTEIAKTITQEFYNEKNDTIPNYGHRKNMLNPYVGYIGIGVTIGTNGMIYFSQEIGNDATYAAKSSFNDRNVYYLTTKNDYANASKYASVDAERNNSNAAADYQAKSDNSYVFSDIRGGASTRNSYVNMYDRDGKLYTNLRLSPGTDWGSDIVAVINGSYYLHVSNNGFVKAADVLPWASFLAGKVITANNNAVIYDDYGNPTSRTVSTGSRWATDRRSIDFNTNVKYYRIGTNAWLLESDLVNTKTNPLD